MPVFQSWDQWLPTTEQWTNNEKGFRRPTCSDVIEPLAQIIVIRVQVGHLLHVLLGDEVQDLGYVPVLDDGHALDGALALHPDPFHVVAAAGAAQLAQAVEVGQGRHGALLPFDRPAEEGEAPQVDVGQRWASGPRENPLNSTNWGAGGGGGGGRRTVSSLVAAHGRNPPNSWQGLKSLRLSLEISCGCRGWTTSTLWRRLPATGKPV